MVVELKEYNPAVDIAKDIDPETPNKSLPVLEETSVLDIFVSLDLP
jgi:hypothetical protein